MNMRTYHPQLAELLSEIEKVPVMPTLRTFGEIVNFMRGNHLLFLQARSKFESIYSNAVQSGKYSTAGLRDIKEDFENTHLSVVKKFQDLILGEIEKWKSNEQRNTFEIVSKAPTEEQSRSLDAVLKRENITKAEIEMWSKNFGDNYACACAFRDFAKKKGFDVVYSDFTDAEERIETIDNAYNYLKDLVKCINTTNENLSYPQLVFYGTNENMEHYKGTWVDDYIRVLDSDSTFKPQKIEVKPITAENN